MSDPKTWLPESTAHALPALCAQLTQKRSTDSGAYRLLVDERPLGLVLMEQGRICWALSEGLEQRLTELLVEQYKLTRRELRALYRDCREQNGRLSEYLVSRGTLTQPELERLMMQHTAEAFRRIAKLRPNQVHWVPHRAGGYRPSFSFPLERVLARAAALSEGVDSEALERELTPLSLEYGWAAAYNARGTLPLAIVGEPALELGALLELGLWAGRCFTRLSQATLQPRAMVTSVHGGTLLIAERGPLLALTWSAQPRALARFLGIYTRGQHGHL